MLGFGGQTALNCGVKLYEAGVFDRHKVKVLGTPVRSLIVSEDRQLFNEALKKINIPFAKSVAVNTVEDGESPSSIVLSFQGPQMTDLSFFLSLFASHPSCQ